MFGDCDVISSERTAELLTRNAAAIERGELEGPPPIDPLILPTRTYRERLQLTVGPLTVELIHTDIHSDDATVLWLPQRRILFCGDTMEDTITYVDDAGSLDTHLANLERLRRLGPARILPNHGNPGVIAGGGYPADLISATEQYIRALQRCRGEPGLRDATLRELMKKPLDAGWIHYFPPYEDVHRQNVATVLGGEKPAGADG